MDPKVEKLRALRAESQMGGGKARLERQRAKGKMTAHERIELLLDKGSLDRKSVV